MKCRRYHANHSARGALDLDNSARMNTPGMATGNWTWRYRHEQLHRDVIDRLQTLTKLYGRSRPLPSKGPEATGLQAAAKGQAQAEEYGTNPLPG